MIYRGMNCKDVQQWRPWFAWRPVRVCDNGTWCIVWREHLQRRLEPSGGEDSYWEYRFPPSYAGRLTDNPAITKGPGNSIEQPRTMRVSHSRTLTLPNLTKQIKLALAGKEKDE